jgi:hypothetical protein
MGRICMDMHGGNKEMYGQFWLGNLVGRDHLGDVGEGGKG